MNFDKNDTTGELFFMPTTPDEKKAFTELLPHDHLGSSKYVNVKSFVDKFGNPTTETYLRIQGKKPGNGEEVTDVEDNL